MVVSIICAVAANGVIGIQNRLPWKLPADLQRFKTLTMGHPIIMGRKTYESIGKPLPGRANIVVTRQSGYRADGCTVAHSLPEALTTMAGVDEAFVIGGADLYAQALPLAERIYWTEVHQDYAGDSRMPAIDRTRWHETAREDYPADGAVPAYSFVTLGKH